VRPSVPARSRPRDRIWWLSRLALVAFCLLAIVPFFYVVSASLKAQRSLYQLPPEWIPGDPTLVNFGNLVSDYPFLRWTANTLLVSSVVALVKVLIDSMAGYALAKLEFTGKRLVGGLMLGTVMIPSAVLIIPLFFMLRDLQLLDTYWALILPPLANPIGVLMMRSYISALPADLEHAAALDGAKPFAIYWHVVMPLVRPGLVVVGIYTFLLQYTNFVLPLIAIESEELQVLTTGVASLNTAAVQPDYGLIAAASVASLIPITAVFIVAQKPFMAASLGGALKE
jgi:multiple sugar transport system permease protein